MEISYGIMCRRKRQKKPPFNLPPFLWRAPKNGLRLDMGVDSAYTTEFLDGPGKRTEGRDI